MREAVVVESIASLTSTSIISKLRVASSPYRSSIAETEKDAQEMVVVLDTVETP